MPKSDITFCISVMNKTLDYLNLTVDSVLENSKYGKDSYFIIYCEYEDKINRKLFDEWVSNKSDKFSNFIYKGGEHIQNIDKKNKGYYSGIGGGMNFCAEQVETKYIMFLHS